MNTQRFLLALIAAILGIHWYPQVAYPVIAVVALAWGVNELSKWWPRHKLERAKRRQLKLDAPLREAFWIKHRAIRAKYDPKHEWNEGTFLPPEYKQEMADLNEEYRDVMDRWSNQ